MARIAVIVKTVGSSYTMKGEHLGPGPWLGLIHECNRLSAGDPMFGSPAFGNDGKGNYAERYPDADVVFVGDGPQASLVSVISKTPRGERLIKQAAESMGLKWNDDRVED